MLADKILAGFPAGVVLPGALRRLCAFAEARDGAVSGDFYFERDGRSSARAWFDGDAAAASQFAVFGMGPDGSLYALWLHAGNDSEKAPVVLLDSESSDNKVVAANMSEFLRLLAMGFSEPGRYPELAPEDADSAEPLRYWLSEEFALSPPKRADQFVESARKSQPDLAMWVRDWQRRRYG
jgi:hypothetical protein